MSLKAKRTGKSRLVIDASVALKWQLDDEECVPQAVARRDDCLKKSIEMCAPTLWLYEVINGFVVASRRGRFPSAEVSQALGDLFAIGVQLRTPDPQRVTALALAHKITSYDSAYLALAEQEGCDLWTGDVALYRCVSGSRVLKALEWVTPPEAARAAHAEAACRAALDLGHRPGDGRLDLALRRPQTGLRRRRLHPANLHALGPSPLILRSATTLLHDPAPKEDKAFQRIPRLDRPSPLCPQCPLSKSCAYARHVLQRQ